MSATLEAANPVQSWPKVVEAPAREENTAERNLVDQLQAGDETAFRQFVEQYQGKIYRIAYRIIGNREDADEIAQQVFVRVYLSVKSFEGRCSLYSWIHRIAVNECYGFLRKRRLARSYEQSDSSDDSMPGLVESAPDPRPGSDDALLLKDLLNKLLARLPEEHRQLLLLRELEGYSVRELSEATGLKENTIKVRLFRTRQQLVAAATRWHTVQRLRPTVFK